MKLLIAILLACLLLAASSARADDEVIPSSEPKSTREARDYGHRMARQVEKELEAGDWLPLAKRYDWALDNAMDRAISELRKRGHRDLADEAAADWNFRYRGFLTRMVLARDIGDHKPLSDWLSKFYLTVEDKIGRAACKALHISDIHSLNHGIAVVFKPCTFDLDGVSYTRKEEYRQHFNGDFSPGGFYGVLPVLVYWAVNVPCLMGTAGLAAFLCGPAASIGEYVTYKWIGPKVSDRIFTRACGAF